MFHQLYKKEKIMHLLQLLQQLPVDNLNVTQLQEMFSFHQQLLNKAQIWLKSISKQ